MNLSLLAEPGTDRLAGATTIASPGDEAARLLAGPPLCAGAEPLAAHEARLGVLGLSASPEAIRSLVRASGLRGRGGGEFPTAAKMEATAGARAAPLVVVNASEGEPASRKDAVLCSTRPHLVLDGALVAAHSVGAEEVVLYAHRARGGEALAAAVIERASCMPLRVRLCEPAERYVAGESSAVVSALEGTGPLPRRRPMPVAAVGVHGRPTLVLNAETTAHLALLVRYGVAWFAAAGIPEAPGSTLLTVAGVPERAHRVVELLAPVRLGRLLEVVAGRPVAPRAVLVGGYAGTWLSTQRAWDVPLTRGHRSAAVPLGCGLLAPLDPACCGVAETARLVRWLAGQSSGQCGPCVYGLAEVRALLDALALGVARRRDLHRLHELSVTLRGRGGCGHPNGVVGLVESALEVFASEVQRHLGGASCDAFGALAGLPLPRESSPCPVP